MGSQFGLSEVGFGASYNVTAKIWQCLMLDHVCIEFTRECELLLAPETLIGVLGGMCVRMLP